MNFFRIPRARLQKTSENSSTNSNDISTVFGDRRDRNRSATENDEIRTEISPPTVAVRPQSEPFQGPKNLYGRFPILGQQRFIINLMKFPSLISTICGCLLLFGEIFDFTNLMKCLSYVSIASGSYSFIITWLICGQSNYQHTPSETGTFLNVKILQLFGSCLFFVVQTILALFAILQIKGRLFDYSEIQWINNGAVSPSMSASSTTILTPTNYLSKSTVICLDAFLFAVGFLGVCLSIMAVVIAIFAKHKLKDELQKYERRNLARANAINFSFGQLRSTNVL